MTISPAGEGYYVGLISGTSMDGIDAVVVAFDSEWPTLLAALTHPFDDDLRASLDAVRLDPDRFPVARIGALDAILGERFAEAALSVIDAAGLKPVDVTAVGSHGQTIVHHAEADPPFTLQIGDPHRIAAQTGITTVADFRRADLAAGGQGAPLAPLLHQALFSSETECRAVVNLGGIANVTLLAPGREVIGFDTGPANCFLDAWYRSHRDEGRFDTNGRWAASGRVDPAWLEALMNDPYFQQPAPKSTGIEYFSPGWLKERLPSWAEARPADIQATLAELSARSLAEALQAASDDVVDRVIVCGGGAANTHLVERLGQNLGGIPIVASDAFGLPADHVEATLFAWLARTRLREQRIDTPPITGARHAVLSGSVNQP
ncbi:MULTISPECIES: anhydro-N-acetylmuramic acid kinase [unclassified Wenzhouxiangella]|uniref:anhydro-N-acetylmuramic acid kinase n=1 Tax=unclassified Wenzhouxiangella TaxID=2613841 RepID=UPI000E325E8F|nr:MULTISPECIES: anhydro-N-acetylmuramic acid kinase [unclassified Wenzhouxiangella]RFF26578.1 anhydro-N-acetylmuramic acid kinase [Wenzhouxiangella sp. 15181]RFP70193.1 anhydro-N-acetylmuramic acid kinase [Wenzhouxiangella sp. 15190]